MVLKGVGYLLFNLISFLNITFHFLSPNKKSTVHLLQNLQNQPLCLTRVYESLRMAPKTRKWKPATKRTDKSEVKIMSEPLHNMVAYLDPEDKLIEYKDITKWLRESRINYAITHQTMCTNH
ncbi:hypothetical protein Hdeb2414_s0009g00314591 [Helianthus debilis subsp. tardiflorus]